MVSSGVLAACKAGVCVSPMCRGIARTHPKVGCAQPLVCRGSGAARAPCTQAGSPLLFAVVKVAHFTAYEKLFSLWHVAHIPFVYLLVLSSIVHVVAVHAY